MSTDKKKLFSLRLRNERIRKGLGQEKLAQAIKVAKGTVGNWEVGKNIPDPVRLKVLSEFLNVDPLWLSGEIGDENEVLSQRKPDATESFEHERGRRRIPVVSWANAGHGADYEMVCQQMEEWIDSDSRDEKAFSVIVEGDSMEPEYFPGDRVELSPGMTPRNGDVVVAKIRSTGEVLLKRFYRRGSEGKTIRLESRNEIYKPREHDIADFEFIYVAVRMERFTRR